MHPGGMTVEEHGDCDTEGGDALVECSAGRDQARILGPGVGGKGEGKRATGEQGGCESSEDSVVFPDERPKEKDGEKG